MLSIFIPVYNEEQILEDSVMQVRDYLSSRGLEHEFIVVSNGSDDGTVAIGEELQTRLPAFKFFHLEEKGPGRAFAYGLKQAEGEFIVCLDVDLSFDTVFLDYANDLLRYAEMVVGSKTMGSQRRTFTRVLGSQMYIMLTNLAFNLTISDYSIGCKAFRRDAILPVLDYIDHWTGHIFELCIYLRCRQMRIIQVGIDCDDQRKSRFNLLHEGYYRYRHLFSCWRKLKDQNSWFHYKAD